MKKFVFLSIVFAGLMGMTLKSLGQNQAVPHPAPPPPMNPAATPPPMPLPPGGMQMPPEQQPLAVQTTPAQPGQPVPGQTNPNQIPTDPAMAGTVSTQPPLPPEMMDPLLEGFFEDIGYNPNDRRDPFLPYLNPALRQAQGPAVPLEPLQKFALGELKLVGIIWDVGQPKALIQDPAGKSHIIIENTKLGTEFGYVAAIREGEVIIVEQQISPEGRKSFQTKVLKLSNIKLN